MNVICELARKNPKNYISLAPVLYKILTTSQNNWLLIKIVKLVRKRAPLLLAYSFFLVSLVRALMIPYKRQAYIAIIAAPRGQRF